MEYIEKSISPEVKQALLNGAFGKTRNGFKCKIIWQLGDYEYPSLFAGKLRRPYLVVRFECDKCNPNQIESVSWYAEDLNYYPFDNTSVTSPIDIIGLWE